MGEHADFFMKRPVTKFIVGKKLHMTQIYDELGNALSVTVVSAQPNTVTQVKNMGNEGYVAVQVATGEKRPKTSTKAVVGHTKTLGKTFAHFREFRLAEPKYQVGDAIALNQFAVGDRVKVIGTSRGRGYQGVVKRHGFHGQPASHGHKDQLRKSGSIGAGGVQRVFKGVRMAGHMGNARVTVANLKVVKIDEEKNELYLEGAVPGVRNSMMMIYQY